MIKTMKIRLSAISALNFVHRSNIIFLISYLFISGCHNERGPSQWAINDPQNNETINHQTWSNFLQKYVISGHPSGINLIRYANVSPSDLDSLALYLKKMQRINIKQYNRNEQLAFWINLFNSATIHLILNHYPVESIRDLDISGFLSEGPWSANILDVMGTSLSLDDIEHDILRTFWQKPRIHYALHFASIGSPNIQPVAFTKTNTDSLFQAGATIFVAHERAMSFRDNILYLNKIYNWYREDFGGTLGSVLEHISHFAPDSLKPFLDEYRGEVRYQFDWDLNQPENYHSDSVVIKPTQP